MVGKLTSFREASATSQQQAVFHEDTTYMAQGIDHFKSKITKSSASTSSCSINYNPTDKATMEHPVSHLSVANYGSFLYA